MKLSVATNWDDELLDHLDGYPILEFYGSMPKTPLGSGRPARILPGVGMKQLEGHLMKMYKKGRQFNYLLNSNCLGGREGDPSFKKEILDYLAWIKDLGIKIVTVTNPFILELIKKRFPGFTVRISIFADIHGTAKALLYESMGADSIAVANMSNRDFHFLKVLRKAVQCGLTILVNQGCLYQCPYAIYHGNINAHASTTAEDNEGFSVVYCILKCTLKKMKNPVELIRSPWVRPEDLHFYEELGYDTFKIAGREKPTTWIVNAVKAYSDRSYNGNLLDLINGVTILEGLPRSRGVPELVSPFVDNRKLDGFLSFFMDNKCRNECAACDYCERVAAGTVNTYKKENESLLTLLEHYSKSALF